MKGIKVILFGYLTIQLLTQCQSFRTVVIRDSPLLLEQSRKAIIAAIGEPLKITQDGRELYSYFYDKKEELIPPDEYPPFRYFTHVIIEGDRRPYTIYVAVWREEKVGEKTYRLEEQDKSLAKRVGSKIRQMLNQSRDKRNIIDDFRPY